MKPRSLRWRVILPPLLILFIGGLILGHVLPNQIIEDQLERDRIQLNNETEIFSRLAASEWEAGSFSTLAQDFSAGTSSTVLILDPVGTVIGSSSTDLPNRLIYRKEMQQAIVYGYGSMFEPAEGSQPPVLYAAREIVVDDQRDTFPIAEISNGGCFLEKVQTKLFVAILH